MYGVWCSKNVRPPNPLGTVLGRRLFGRLRVFYGCFRGTDSNRLVPEKTGANGFRLIETEPEMAMYLKTPNLRLRGCRECAIFDRNALEKRPIPKSFSLYPSPSLARSLALSPFATLSLHLSLTPRNPNPESWMLDPGSWIPDAGSWARKVERRRFVNLRFGGVT